MSRFAWIPLALLVAGCSGGAVDDQTPAQLDSDGDGLNDAEEAELGLNPNSADTDNDGMSDKAELDAGTDPLLADTDGDGLEDGAEVDLGTDPLSADSDNDLLSDSEEVALGTDPNKKDTDKDDYTDFEEVDYGSDPLDKTSKIYTGGWPYNPEKELLVDPGFVGSISLGGPMPDLVGVDQFGEQVRLYDFMGHGKPIIVDYSAEWCPPCNALADYMSGIENGFDYPLIRDAVNNGDVFWFTVLLEDNFGAPADEAVCASWASIHPDEEIPITGPADTGPIFSWLGLQYFPTLVWVNDDATVNRYNLGFNPYMGADALEDELAGY